MSGLNVLTPEALTWEQAVRLFLLRCKSGNLSPHTQELYTIRLDLFRRWLASNDNPTPSAVGHNHLRAFLEACKARGNKPATVDVVFRILRTFWTFLHRDGLILVNPMDKVERPRREKKFIKPMTEAELRLILEQIDTKDLLGLRDHALTLFLADSGLRISEALAIKLSDIDWSGNTVVVFGKGRRERRIAFGQTARRAVQLWIQRRGACESSDYLWVNRYGRQMLRRNYQQRLKQYTKDAGIAAERLSPHALRHFFALQFLKNGGDAMTLQKLLGHSTLEMVRNYVNMTDDDAIAKHRLASPLDKLGPLPNERKRVRLQ